MTQVPAQLVEVVKRFEGFSPKPYLCPAGYWTIGYGHRCDKERAPVSEAEAIQILTMDLVASVREAIVVSPVLGANSPAKLSAIASFVFNVGGSRYRASTLRRKVAQQDWFGAAGELGRWVYGGGRVLPGLVARRKAEANLILS